MNNEEANQVLQELNEVRPEMLNDKAKRLFEAIMLIADERDKANERVDELINEVTIKDSKLELKDQVIWFMANRLTTEYHDIDWVTNYYYEEAKNYLEKKQNFTNSRKGVEMKEKTADIDILEAKEENRICKEILQSLLEKE